MSTVRLSTSRAARGRLTHNPPSSSSTPSGDRSGAPSKQANDVIEAGDRKGHEDAASPLPDYQLGEILGRGAFGSVYRALNWTTGETVAVKQVALGSIPASDLPEIMLEIDLLKNLDHPNIVQYRGFVKTQDYLFVILEFCENGSLHALIKRFGKMPETLVSVYICQVLEGLLYLHEQGVIHRDIKASNMLADKEGRVRLGDFGVSTRAGALADNAVVGSPYWMAPEVVSQGVASQGGGAYASDIWSVGCLVVELLEGKPPYHFLDPMPALFRIVNDDCPPIPESASATARDFMLQCFQKDPNLRISARKLIKHPWMVAAKRRIEEKEREQGRRTPFGEASRGRQTGSDYDETVKRVQDWNRAIDGEEHTQARPTGPGAARRAQNGSTDIPSSQAPHRTLHPPATSLPVPMQRAGAEPSGRSLREPSSNLMHPTAALSSVISARVNSAGVGVEVQGDVWDDDFEGGIPSMKLAGLDTESGKPALKQPRDKQATVRSPLLSKRIELVPPPAAEIEDYSHLLEDDQKDPFEGRIASLKASSALNMKSRLLHPKAIPSVSPPALAAAPERPHMPSTKQGARSPTATAAIEDGVHLHRFKEQEEDYSDVFDEKETGQEPETFQLTAKLSGRSWLGDEDSDEDDPFAEVEEDLTETEEATLEADIARDRLARLSATVVDIVDRMTPSVERHELVAGCTRLVEIFDTVPQIRSAFIRAHGMLAVIELLQQFQYARDVVSLLLRIVNLIVTDDAESLEKICLCGGCPVVMSFASNKHPREIRLEAALFIGSMCQTSLLTLQMFISCRGLKMLVEMVQQDYDEQRDLVWCAVDGICRVFDFSGPTPRSEFCRIFAREGLLEPLSEALLSVAEDSDPLAVSARDRIVHIFLLFSQGDARVKESLLTRPITLRLIRCLSTLSGDLFISMLKTIKNLTMLPTGLAVLQNANAIEVLVKVLREQYADRPHSPVTTEVANHVVNALYNLLRLDKSRQEEAALAGAIPVLQLVVKRSSPLKQFALPLLMDFAHTSRNCRKILWQRDGFSTYLSLLGDPFWGATSLEALLAWLSDETARVEDALSKPSSLDALFEMFATAKASTFESLLDPMLKLFRLSAPVARSLTAHTHFISKLVERLLSHNKAVVRLNLLRLVRALFDAADAKHEFVGRPGLGPAVCKLAAEDSAVLVRGLAKDIHAQLSSVRPVSSAPKRKPEDLLRQAQGQSTPINTATRRPSSPAPPARVPGGMYDRLLKRNSVVAKKPSPRS